MEAKVKRAAIYTRVSTDKQAEKYGPAYQETELRQWAETLGYRIVEVVSDPDYKRSDITRPGLNRLRRLAEEGQIQAVLAWQRDRFGEPLVRDLLEAELSVHDVVLLSMNDSPDETTNWFLDLKAKLETRDIARRTKAGKMAKVREGKIVAGKYVNYGFKLNESRDAYEVDPETAPTLRRIFEEVADGKPMNAIADQLNREGVPSPSGGRWLRTTIRQLILDDVYLGTWYYNRRRVKKWRDPETGRKRTKTTMKPKDEWLAVEVPRIVDDALVGAARAAIKDNVRPSKMGDKVWELTGGIMRCGTCGKAMVARSNRARPGGPKRHYYCCTTYRPQDKEGMCGHNRYYRAEKVERAAAEMVTGFTADRERIVGFLMERVVGERDRLLSLDPETETKALAAKLSKLKTALERNKEMYAAGIIGSMDELKAKLADIEDQQRAVSAELDKIANRKRHIEELERDAEIVLQAVDAGGLSVLEYATPEFRRDTYRKLGLRFKLSEGGRLEVEGQFDKNWLPDYDELYGAHNTTEYILPTAPQAEPKI